jgi:hypothetical protein
MEPGAYPPRPPAAEQVRLPAIFLLVTGILGAVGQVISLLFTLLGTGLDLASAHLGPSEEAIANAMSGTMAVFFSILGLLTAAVIVFGALRMKDLRSHSLAVAASVIAMVPCASPCCLLGLPVGIWALVVLLRPEVKAAFTA